MTCLEEDVHICVGEGLELCSFGTYSFSLFAWTAGHRSVFLPKSIIAGHDVETGG